MPKILREDFANKTVGISNEMVAFDSNGIGEIKSQAVYDDVIKLAGFFKVTEKKDEEKEPVKEKVEEPKEKDEPKVEEKEKVESKKETKKTTKETAKAKTKK